MNTEMKYKKATRQVFKVVFAAAKKLDGVDIDADALDMTFTRNFPANEKEELEVAVMKKTLGLSFETILKQLSFVTDAEEEMTSIKADTANVVTVADPNTLAALEKEDTNL